eukprot:CAMPEP_0172684188 /NCGR_PEP_ID=MMETSP1074-20121228/19382_1 /TAXON_ID=2916 /ORGANISM="Ceratium fusus, Strain PA161109" /LENGTH=216 /DNA_ID=CAMNT_0013503155 /DNA_START=83 /DNA_END=733 /DNA_ORIENTATION=-
MRTTVALVLAVLTNFLSVNAKEVGCPVGPQTGTDCAAAASPGDSALAFREDAKTHSSTVEDEEAYGEANKEKEEWSTKLMAHKRLLDADLEEANKKKCKHASITVHKADGLLAQGYFSVDPYVKVTYKGDENKDLTFQTEYEARTANPTWNHTEAVLLCNMIAPMRFEIYDKNWVTSDTFVAQAELAGREFWKDGFSDSLLLDDGGKGLLHVTIQH